MYLKISTTHFPATDLGYLLHKHPDKLQEKELAFGKALVFYPEKSDDRCAATLLLHFNPVALTRQQQRQQTGSFDLGQYVNDRPYVASSFMSTAIAKVFGSALNGKCKDKPELVHTALPLEITVAAVRCWGGIALIKRFFEPLGYELELYPQALDEQHPEWGESPYFQLQLKHQLPLFQVLRHLYILLPALDNSKHYYVNEFEIEKLLDKGKDWLNTHPELPLISRRFLKHKKSYSRKLMEQLGDQEVMDEIPMQVMEEALEEKVNLHQLRHQTVIRALKKAKTTSIVDLGCGSGKLLVQLLRVPQFKRILGMDVSYRSLEVAQRRLRLDQNFLGEKVKLIHGSLIYRDRRISGFDAAVLVEVIEHLDEARLAVMVENVFRYAQPKMVIVTTPNAEYNVLFEGMVAGQLRHPDHRFEWTRIQFQDWGAKISKQYNYQFTTHPVGEVHPEHGGPSQMGIFLRQED